MTTKIEYRLIKCSPDTFEKVCSDFLTEEGYNVQPTGTKGSDKGIDAFLDGKKELHTLVLVLIGKRK